MLAIIAGCVILSIASILLLKHFYKFKILEQYLSKIRFQLTNEREKNQTLNVELVDLNKKVTARKLVDPLTGVINRQTLEDRLSQVLSQSKRYRLTFAVMVIDIDELEMINNVLGYDAGDELLKEIAKRLQNCMRQMDTFSRFSGDSFALILPQLAKAEVTIYIAQRYLEALSEPFHFKGQELFISVNIGVAIYPTDGDNVKTLLKNASCAANQSKTQGRNVFQFYRKDLDEQSRRELLINSALRSPDVYQSLKIYYQQQIDIETKKMIGVETVIHWQHADFGLIPSAEFLRLAEQSGKILEFGEWMLRQGLTQFREWLDHGVKLKHIFIPVSLRQLESSHFIYKISEILQELNIDARCLVLQVTENSLSLRLLQIEKAFKMLKHLGVQIAVACFGAGHLSFRQIEKLPINYFVIDESLIENITTQRQCAAIVKMIFAIAKSMEFGVIADGVTQKEQEELLKEFGCSLMQGSIFGPLLLGQEVEQQSASISS